MTFVKRDPRLLIAAIGCFVLFVYFLYQLACRVIP